LAVRQQTGLIDPAFFNSFLLFAIILHFTFPIQTILPFPLTLIGLAPITIGLVTSLQAQRTLRNAKTTSHFADDPDVLITDGVYRYTRNPIYLGGLLLSFGLAMCLGSLISFIFPILLFLLLRFLYIPNEEHRLTAKFGTQYLEYMKRVRKWM
jgi:protein-S-isoprenylcysteine O-methyltransferase Ste14